MSKGAKIGAAAAGNSPAQTSRGGKLRRCWA